MKPGNLSLGKRCQIRRQTKDEDSIYAHRVFGVRFLIFRAKNRKDPNNGKKTLYL